MKKAFDQTVRDLKRGVNKKVLKVPSIEQKVLDATSNEPWGPHGSLLADIAQATRNYHEYQMIMSVIWKRINDTGKNWRHVYKALTVLEYLVAHGSERVIDEIREHAYQISTLSDFQYIDSSGKDQGNNVRKKSQSLVVLVNDKERIQEVRQKAAANREKYRNTPMGSTYRPGSGSSPGGYGDRYDDDRYESRYGNRDDDRNGYGREREWGSRDDDRYGRCGDSYGREGERYSRDSEDRYGRDGYRDDDYRYGSRSRSADRERERGSEDDGTYSSSSKGKTLDRKFSEQNLDAPPSYEEAVGPARSPTINERDGESSVAQAPKAYSPGRSTPSHTTTAAAPPLAPASPTTSVSPSAPASAQPTAQTSNKEVDDFDEFDPRGSFSAAPTASNGAAPAAANVEMDLLGSLSESFSSNALALTVQPSVTADTSASGDLNSGATFAAASSGSTTTNQPFDDPFGDGPFKALLTTDSAPGQQQTIPSTNSFDTNSGPQKGATTEFGGPFYDATQNMPSGPSTMQPLTNTQFAQQELPNPNQGDVDILADILPPSAPSSSVVPTQSGYAVPPNESHSFPPQTNQPPPQNSFQLQTGQSAGFPTQPGQPAGFPTQPGQPAGFPTQPGQPAGFPMQPGQPAGFPTQPGQPAGFPTQSGQPAGFPTQPGQPAGFPTQPGQPAGFPTQPGQPAGFPTQPGQPAGFPIQTSYPMQSGESVPQTGFVGQTLALTYPIQGGQAPQMVFNNQGTPQQNPNFYGAYHSQPVSTGGAGPYVGSGGATMQHNFLPQSSAARPSSLMAPQTSSMPTSTVSSNTVPQPTQDKFQTKSTVWTDTLSRGLVNLNISGSKTNPLADIGVDFDAINRKEKRMEKPTTATVTSTVTMGKAMGSGSGMGRAGASALRPPPSAMVVSGQGMGMGGYGASQPMGRGVGMGMNMGMGQGNMGMGQGNMGMGMGMNMGMGQGIQMPQQGGFPPGSTMPGGAGGYNHMMGAGNYGQQPYGGGYR